MSAPVQAAGGQIQGRRRRQEDAWALERYGDDEVLALVADGLGGHPAGDVASREGVREFVKQFADRRARGTATPRQWLQDSTLATHGVLVEMTRTDRKLREMATTLVVLYVRGAQFWAVSVGDSYLLLRRRGKLVRLNELHSEAGGVTSCLGFNLSRVDIADGLAVEAGDRFLIASDGIVTLDEAEVTGLLGAAPDADAAARDLLDAVDKADLPTQDNTTVVAVFA
jgi:serine/threonine protein phosphatase PrpC